MENNQQPSTKGMSTPRTQRMSNKGYIKAKKLLVKQMLDLIQNRGFDVSDLARHYHRSRETIYRILDTEQAHKLIEKATMEMAVLTPKAITGVSKGIDLQDDADPDIVIKSANLSKDVLYGLGVLKKRTQEQGVVVPIQDLKGILDAVVKDIMVNKIEAEYNIAEQEQTPAVPEDKIEESKAIEPQQDTTHPPLAIKPIEDM